MGYLVKLKTTLVDAIRQTFDTQYPEEDFRDLWASIEFPAEPQNYPGVWVDYIPVGNLKRIGVGHLEYDETGGLGRAFTRWRFQGQASFTCVAMTSLERDRLHDEMVGMIAFGAENPYRGRFRQTIEAGEFLAINMDADEIDVRGMTSQIGTPWQTDDMIYECEIVIEVLGEFVADVETHDLVKLTDVNVREPYTDQEIDPYASEDGWV